ncbi:MAG: hypothetical protein KatS3mg102_2500 [Planctomycetota bacterium]|nr:MAG: hypothetical protein KatS3mg102_2500 [Planctomycetota bacterium]
MESGLHGERARAGRVRTARALSGRVRRARGRRLGLALLAVAALAGAPGGAGCASRDAAQGVLQQHEGTPGAEAVAVARLPDWDAVLAEAPADPARYLELAAREFETGRRGRALALAEAARALAVADPGLRARAEALARAARTDPASSQGARRGRRAERALAAALAHYRRGALERALAELEGTSGSETGDPEARRLLAAVHLGLAGRALAQGQHERAAAHLWAAADAHATARQPQLYRELARLARRRALAAELAGSAAQARAALLEAFIAAPDEPETLLLLSSRPHAGPGAVPERARAAWQALLLRAHPESAAAHYLLARAAIARAQEPEQARRIAEEFGARHPGAPVLAAELHSLAAERASEHAAREAVAARRELERLLAEAQRARIDLESELGGATAPPAGDRRRTTRAAREAGAGARAGRRAATRGTEPRIPGAVSALAAASQSR